MITAGEILKNKRESLGKSLDTVSLDTKIQKRFLINIEENEYSEFESEIFLTGFIKIYSKYLDLDTEKILALYRRSSQKRKAEKIPEAQKIKTLKKLPIISLKTFITILLIIFSLSVLGYVGFQIYRFQTPPTITLEQPDNNITTENPTIEIVGKTSLNTTISINDIPTDVDENGEFKKTVTLNEGPNTILIKARKNNNNILESTVTRKITFTPPQIDTPDSEEIPSTNSVITLEVVGTASWIKLDIDNKNVISEVIKPSEVKYNVKESFYLITGRVNNTKIFYNGDLLEWRNSRTGGVAEMRCTIKNKAINCQ